MSSTTTRIGSGSVTEVVRSTAAILVALMLMVSCTTRPDPQLETQQQATEAQELKERYPNFYAEPVTTLKGERST